MLMGSGQHDLPLSSKQPHWFRVAAGWHSRVLALEPVGFVAIGERVARFAVSGEHA